MPEHLFTKVRLYKKQALGEFCFFSSIVSRIDNMNISYKKASILACLPEYFLLKEEPWIYGSKPSEGPAFEPGDIVEKFPFPTPT